MSLKNKTINGIRWTTLSTVITLILQLTQLVILSRVLDPIEFGLIAIIMIVVGFSLVFVDMGISNAIIHKKNITREQLSTLYWINLLSGLVIFIIIFFSSTLVANFYNEQGLTKLIKIVGLTFFIQPFGNQFMVLWQKELKFKELSIINIISKIISFIVTIWLVLDGFGVYSIAYGLLIGTIFQTAIFVHFGLKEYKPLFVFKIKNVKEIISFGLFQMGQNLIGYLNSQIDIIIIGKILDIETLGIYNLAKQFIMRPAQVINPIITKVTLPVMAIIQDDIEKLKNIYLKTVNYLSSINFAIYGIIFLFAHDIVIILFGEKWIEVVVILKILS